MPHIYTPQPPTHSITPMAIYSLYIISKSGSLLYQRDFKAPNSPITKQKSNDYLIIASNLHGIHTIAAKLTPPAAKPTSASITTTTMTSTITTTSTTTTTSAPITTSASNTNQLTHVESKDSSIQLERLSLTSIPNTPGEDDFTSSKKYNGGGINVHSNKTGLRCVQTDKFNMFIHQTVTGVKVIILTSTDLNEYQISNFQTTIYRLYADYVMKNPFYGLDMPIRIKLFDDKIMSAVINYNIK